MLTNKQLKRLGDIVNFAGRSNLDVVDILVGAIVESILSVTANGCNCDECPVGDDCNIRYLLASEHTDDDLFDGAKSCDETLYDYIMDEP